jgi:hypothetical protein
LLIPLFIVNSKFYNKWLELNRGLINSILLRISLATLVIIITPFILDLSYLLPSYLIRWNFISKIGEYFFPTIHCDTGKPLPSLPNSELRKKHDVKSLHRLYIESSLEYKQAEALKRMPKQVTDVRLSKMSEYLNKQNSLNTVWPNSDHIYNFNKDRTDLYSRTYTMLYEKYHSLGYNKYQIDYMTNDVIKSHNRESLTIK